jgi:hypothetical protein
MDELEGQLLDERRKLEGQLQDERRKNRARNINRLCDLKRRNLG